MKCEQTNKQTTYNVQPPLSVEWGAYSNPYFKEEKFDNPIRRLGGMQ